MSYRWSEAAELRRRQIESGLDLTFTKVFLPYYRDVLARLKPTSVLEVGGGTGHLAQSLSDLAARYVMIEPALGMHTIAQEVLSRTGVCLKGSRIEDFVDDRKFDLVLSHMCVQTVSDLPSFLRGLAKHLSPTGSSFLLALPHPVFYNDYKRFFAASEFRYSAELSKQISFCITLDPGEAIKDVPYHHRPLSTYVSEIAIAGLCVTRLDEIFPSPEVQDLYGHRWENPRYLVLGGRPLE